MIEIYDIETLKSCFTYVGINKDTGEISKFVIHKDKDEHLALVKHILSLSGMVGFNNNSFDYPIIHHFLKNYKRWKTPEEIIDNIYLKAQEIITKQNLPQFSNFTIKASECFVSQLDLFKLWHYNNPARSCSLKALEIAMNFSNVMESKVPHTKEDITLEEVEDILEYNLNDVEATLEFYTRSREKIDLRKYIQDTQGIYCLNFPDVKLGEEILLNNYSKEIKADKWEIKKKRTLRNQIVLKDCISDKIQFKTKEFNKVLDKFKSSVITGTKDSFSESVIFKGIKIIYGTGGLHAATYSGVYTPNPDEVIKSLDVASLYPSLAIVNSYYPEHLGIEFCKVYKELLDSRLVAKKAGNTALSDAYKLSLNGAYGKSSDENSFLYDPKFTMQITLNGQLFMSMLIEELGMQIPEIKFILVNTDGFEVIIPKNKEVKYLEICKQWEEYTRLILEFTEYDKIVLADVNNYSAKYSNGKFKYKGKFEIDKVVGNEIAYHKDNSFKIIPIALSEYFFNGISVETTIKSHQNIYDYCGRQKFKSDSYGEIHFIDETSGIPVKNVQKQQKNVRYYISNKGSTFIKRYNKGGSEFINKGFQVTIFNKYVEKSFEEYDINYQYYIRECNKIIEQLENNQLALLL